MHSALGNDSYGAKISAELEHEGVATAGIQVYAGSSHVAFALAEPGRDRRTIFWHNNPGVINSLVLDEHLLRSARGLLLDTHLGETAIKAARLANEAGMIVMLDAERLREHTLELLPFCNVQIVSENFARQVTNEEDRFAAARALHKRYGQLVVVTGGSDGSWLVGRGEAFHCPAFAIEAVDTTGAGDVFHGAFMYGLLQGWELPFVTRFASATAALKCRALGGRAGIPRLEEALALARS
jgi:sulfofructose kinase